MFPDGAQTQPAQQPTQVNQPPVQQATSPQIPVQQQQQFQQPASMPVIPPPIQAQAPRAPQQPAQSQQPVQPNYDSMYQQIAASLGTTPDVVRQQLGDDPAMGMASLVRDAVGVLNQRKSESTQATPVSQQQQQQLSPDGKLPMADGWQTVVKQNAQGVYEPISPHYKQYADAANHNAIIDRQRFERFQADPTLLMQDPAIQQTIQKQIQDAVQAHSQQQQVLALREEYKSKFAKDIFQVNEQGAPKVGMDGKPIMTPLGIAVAKHFNNLANTGMQESRQLYEAAMILAKNELGVQNFAANVQQQQYPHQQGQHQGFQQQIGLPQYQQQQYAAQAQPQTVNLAAMLQQNSQAYYPGQAPPRGPVPQPTIEGALYAMLQDFPDGLSTGQYLDQIGPLFQTAGRR